MTEGNLQEDNAVAAPDAPAAQRDDVHSDVAAAIASLRGEATEPDPAEQGETRARADGKFIQKDAAPPAEAAQAAAPDPKSPPADNLKAPAQPSNADEPPTSWAADAKTSWSSLPPAIQTAVLKREAEITEGFRQKSDDLRRYESALAPLQQESQRFGLSVDEGIKRLLDGQRFLEQKPVEAIQWLAQRHGINLAQLATDPNAVVPQRPAVDPSVAHLVNTIPLLEQRLASFEVGQNMTMVQSFAANHPHYAEVEDRLPDLIKEIKAANPQMDPQKVLESAYERAVWLTPDVRAKVIASQQQEEAEKARAAAAEKASQAKRAAVSIKGSSGTAVPPKREEAGGDVFDDVRQAMRQLRAG